MYDLFHKILVFLYNKNGLNQSIELNDFFNEEFNGDTDKPEVLLRIRQTMGQLVSAKYIEHESLPNWGQDTNTIFHTLETDKAIAILNLLGHNYIAEKISKSNQDDLLARQTIVAEKTGGSVVSTNDFTIENAKKNNRLFWLTLVVAAIIAFAGVRSCRISNEVNNRERDKLYQDTLIQSMQNKIIQTRNTLSVQQNLIDSLRNASKNDTTNTKK